jgi:hypothetical protein
MVLFLPIFAELPLTPKMNSHKRVVAELDLERLLPAAAEPPGNTKNYDG